MENPTGSDTGSRRVLRGGSLADTSWICRSANRNSDYPGYFADFVGFHSTRQLLLQHLCLVSVRSNNSDFRIVSTIVLSDIRIRFIYLSLIVVTSSARYICFNDSERMVISDGHNYQLIVVVFLIAKSDDGRMASVMLFQQNGFYVIHNMGKLHTVPYHYHISTTRKTYSCPYNIHL